MNFIGHSSKLSTEKWGDVLVESQFFSDAVDGDIVIYFGSPLECERPLVRIHSVCVFGEVLGSLHCDCATQLELALKMLSSSQRGILVYLRMDGRGAGLSAKISATKHEINGMDTHASRIHIGVDPDSRSYQSIGGFLKSKEVLKVELLTNNPVKAGTLRGMGIDVDVVPLKGFVGSEIGNLLIATKKIKFGHWID